MKNQTSPFGKKHIMISSSLIILCAAVNLTCCKNSKKSKAELPGQFHTATAQFETKPVPRDSTDDAADDPAIWINFTDPGSSRIIGTDKKGGLAVYSLDGQELFYYNTGLMNNADLRYNFPLSSDTIDIMAVSNRTDQSVDLYRINRDGSLQEVHKQQLFSKMKEEVYGLCMYQSKITGKFFVFVNDKNGVVEQWELSAEGDKVAGRLVRNLKLASQVEGMVADDESGMLYIGEEDKGIWKFDAEPAGSVDGSLIPMSGEKDNGNITFDIEGLAVYKVADNDGYLIASSQGNDSYAFFERKSPHKYIGSIRIISGEKTDGSEETDGLDVVNFPFSDQFPNGILVVQDGHNKDNSLPAAQNYKIIGWDKIATEFNPPLKF